MNEEYVNHVIDSLIKMHREGTLWRALGGAVREIWQERKEERKQKREDRRLQRDIR